MTLRVALLLALLPTGFLACNGSQAGPGENRGGDASSEVGADAAIVQGADSGGPGAESGVDATVPSDAATGEDATDGSNPESTTDAAEAGPAYPVLAPDVLMILGLTSDGYIVYARTASEVDVVPLAGGAPTVITSSPKVHTVLIRDNVVLAGNVVWTAATGPHSFTAGGGAGDPTAFAIAGDNLALAYEDDAGVSRALMATRDLSVQIPLGPSTCDITFGVVAGTLTTASCVATEDGGVIGSVDAWDEAGIVTHLLSSADPFLSIDGDDPSGTLFAASGSTVASIPIGGGDPTVFFQEAFKNDEYGGVQQVKLLPGHTTLGLSLFEGGYSFSPIAAPALTTTPNSFDPTVPPSFVDCSGPIDEFSSDGNWLFSGGCMTSVSDGRNELPYELDSGAYPTFGGGTFTFDAKYAVTWETVSDSDENWLALHALQTGTNTMLAPYLVQLLWGGMRTLQVSADSRIVYIDATGDGNVLTIVDPSMPQQKVAIASGVGSFVLDRALTGVFFADVRGLHYLALP
jgi:hypothetical protein